MVNIYQHVCSLLMTHLLPIMSLNSSSLLFFPVVLGFYSFCFMCERPAFVFSSFSGIKNVMMTFIICLKRKAAEDLDFQKHYPHCVTTNLLCKPYLHNEKKDKSQPRLQIIPNFKLKEFH